MSNFRTQSLAMFGGDTEADFQAEFIKRNSACIQAVIVDPRLPRSAIGYAADLQNQGCSWPVAVDRMNQIRRHIPEIKFWGE